VLLTRDRGFAVGGDSARQGVSASVYEPIVYKERSLILPEGDNGVDCKGSLASFIKSSLINSI